MATALEECTTEDYSSVVNFFLWAKGLNAKDIHKEMFPVYGRKCLTRKAVQHWVKTLSQGRLKVADNGPLNAELADTAVKRLLRCVFRCSGKAMG